MPGYSFKSRLFLMGFLFAVFLKFWLIWEMEIADAADDPHDYVFQILYPANGGLAYPPGTGLVGLAFHALGIPFRLGLETAFLLASALVIRALLTWPWKSFLGLGLFAFVIFDPALAELFSHLFSDQVWLVETMLGLAFFVFAFQEGNDLRWSRVILALFFFALSIVTRSVAIPLLMATNLFTLLALGLTLLKYRSKNLRRSLHLLALAFPTLILGLCFIYLGVCRQNLVTHGYTGISFIDSNEYKKFYLCLQSVGDPTGDAYFPIDENRRRLIAQAGPDSKWFVRQLDENGYYKQVGLDHYEKYDIPAGWFHWATFAATMHDGNYIAAFAVFSSIEDEISTANKMGLIKVRPILPLPDSRVSIVLSVFPKGVQNSIGNIIYEPPADAFASGGKTLLYQNPEFTKALNRRAVTESPFRDKIWRFLDRIYSWIYTPALFALYVVAFLIYLAVIVAHWKTIEEFPLPFIARQFFTVLFIVLIFWYALFDASGMPVMYRYMIFNHVLMPILIGFYLVTAARLLRHKNL